MKSVCGHPYFECQRCSADLDHCLKVEMI